MRQICLENTNNSMMAVHCMGRYDWRYVSCFVGVVALMALAVTEHVQTSQPDPILVNARTGIFDFLDIEKESKVEVILQSHVAEITTSKSKGYTESQRPLSLMTDDTLVDACDSPKGENSPAFLTSCQNSGHEHSAMTQSADPCQNGSVCTGR